MAFALSLATIISTVLNPLVFDPMQLLTFTNQMLKVADVMIEKKKAVLASVDQELTDSVLFR